MNLLTNQEVKSFSTEQLREILAPFKFKTTPHNHQLASLAWALERKRIAYWLDIGTGKTLIALYTLKIWNCQRILVICPNSIIYKTWAEEITKHTGWKYSVLKGNQHQRRYKLDIPARVYIINYEGLKYLWARKMEGGFKYDKNLLKDVDFDAIVFDESHSMKSRKALVTKIASGLSLKIPNVIMMTGSPLTNNLQDLWAESFVLDHGMSLGTSFYGFLNTYFNKYGFEWKPKRWALEDIIHQLADKTIRYERDECFDLPDLTYERRQVNMSQDQIEYTRQVIENEISDETLYNKPVAILNVGNRLLQIAGGFALIEGKDTIFKTNPKMNELGRLFEEISGQVIVFHQYIQEGRMIEELCKRRKIKFASMRGETKDKDEEIRKFQAGECKVLVAHPACAGQGLNFQNCNTIIFYSNDYNMTHRMQAIGRIYRMGQKKPCLIIDLVATDGETDGIDIRILEALKNKQEMAQSVLDYMLGKKLEEELIERMEQ